MLLSCGDTKLKTLNTELYWLNIFNEKTDFLHQELHQ